MEPKQEHKLISHADILLIVGILILAVAGLFAWKKLETPGAYVDIMIDGDSVKTLRLDQDASYEVKQQVGVNTVVVSMVAASSTCRMKSSRFGSRGLSAGRTENLQNR